MALFKMDHHYHLNGNNGNGISINRGNCCNQCFAVTGYKTITSNEYYCTVHTYLWRRGVSTRVHCTLHHTAPNTKRGTPRDATHALQATKYCTSIMDTLESSAEEVRFDLENKSCHRITFKKKHYVLAIIASCCSDLVPSLRTCEDKWRCFFWLA